MAAKGQGATEYLVLLAVVLIIALVGVALLGFFPGTANDAQMTESQIYWQSAGPIAVTEVTGAYWDNTEQMAGFSMRIRNSGAYPVRLQKLLGGNTSMSTRYDYVGSGYKPLSDIYLYPGEELCIGREDSKCNTYGFFFASPAAAVVSIFLRGLSAWCDANGAGTLVMPNFGFEYVQYVEGQQITKRQIGTKPLYIRCMGTKNY